MSTPTQNTDGDHKSDDSPAVGSRGESTSTPNPRRCAALGVQGSSRGSTLPTGQSSMAANGNVSSSMIAIQQQLGGRSTIVQGHAALSITSDPMFAPFGTAGTIHLNNAPTSTDAIQATIFANMLSQMARYNHQHLTNLQHQHTTEAHHVTVHQHQPASSPASQQHPASSSSTRPDAAEQLDDGPKNNVSIGKVLFLESDIHEVSPYQCLVRQQIEAFAQPESETEGNVQGRNRAVLLGQVGIRCRHCGTRPLYRTRGAILFPSTLLGLYQAAQNMANTHLVKTCRLIPEETRRDLIQVRSKEKGKKTCKSSYGGGRRYWADSLSVLGVVETADRGLRFGTSRGLGSVDTGYGQAANDWLPPANKKVDAVVDTVSQKEISMLVYSL
jgi:hypothetical protein